MKSFATIAVSTLLLLASAPAFAHGSGHAGMNGMNGMNGGNSHNTMTMNTQTQTNNSWNKIHNSSTKTDMTGHHSFGHERFLRTEEHVLTHEINELQGVVGRLLLNGSNPTKLAHLSKELFRLRAKLFRVQIDIARQVS